MGVPLQFLNDVVLPYMGDDCLTWPYAKINGYGCIASGRSKAHSVSRLVCAHVWGPPPSANHQAAHKCGKGHEGCVNPLHLEWKTPSENNQDKAAHGTAQRGERCNNSKLTELDVREIREMRKSLPERLVAKQFGLNRRTVNSIVRRQSWQHVD